MPAYSLKQHDNGTFYIHWSEGRRSKRQSTGEKEEVAAQIFLGEWLKTDAADRDGAEPVFLIDDLWNFYSKRHLEKNGSDPRTAAANNLLAHFGKLTLPEVARTLPGEDGGTEIDRYTELRIAGTIGRRPAKPETVRTELSMLKACFNWCAAPKQKIINPAHVPIFDIPAAGKARDTWLRADEIQRMAATAAAMVVAGEIPRAAFVFLWLALETAARRGAILQLAWSRVDFELGTIDYRVPGQRVTRKRRAIVPISTALRPVLVEAFERRDGDLVCAGLQKGVYYYYIGKIAKRAGVKHATPHVLRHTAATHMLRNGVPIWIVAGVLGDTIATVERVYGHHIPSDLSAGVEAISGQNKPGIEGERVGAKRSIWA